MLPSVLLLITLSISVSACSYSSHVVSNSSHDQLAFTYPSLVLRSDAANYSTENLDFWDVRSADVKPKCMFLPTDADMVAAGVSILASCGSQFAVRGGHMNFPGANKINNGVLL